MKKIIFISLVSVLMMSCGTTGVGSFGAVLKNDVAAPGIVVVGERSDENLTHATEFFYETDASKSGEITKALVKLVPHPPIEPLHAREFKNKKDKNIEELSKMSTPPILSGVDKNGNTFYYTDNGQTNKYPDDHPVNVYHKHRLTLLQEIYTPENIESFDVQQDDNPFAAWLALRIADIIATKNTREETGLEIGVIGKYAFGEEIQTYVHKLCGCADPNGWDNQLGTEVGVVLSHIREYRTYNTKNFLNLGIHSDIISGTNVRLGNIHTDASYHKLLRLGYNLPDLDKNRNNWSLYFFVDGILRLIGRNIFYDGNTFKSSHSVDKEYTQAEVDTGVSLEYHNWKATLEMRTRTRDYKQQDEAIHSFGMFTITRSW